MNGTVAQAPNAAAVALLQFLGAGGAIVLLCALCIGLTLWLTKGRAHMREIMLALAIDNGMVLLAVAAGWWWFG